MNPLGVVQTFPIFLILIIVDDEDTLNMYRIKNFSALDFIAANKLKIKIE
jgi:hypothetical protein